jgi:hypothetical protein
VQRVGLAVRAGPKKPDIATDDALRKTLVDAKSIGHSIGPSGDHFSKVIIARLGIAEQLEPKITVVRGIPVAAAVAKGDAEIGIHEIIELMPIPGIDIVGVLPADLDKTIVGRARETSQSGLGCLFRFPSGRPGHRWNDRHGFEHPHERAGVLFQDLAVDVLDRIAGLVITGIVGATRRATEHIRLGLRLRPACAGI